MTKELKEILDELAAVKGQRSALVPLAETAEQAEIEAREKELNELDSRQKALEAKKAEVEAAEQKANDFANGKASGTEVKSQEGKTMTIKEIRNSADYISAYAKYIKTGKDDECRALLTTNATDGVVPVPEFIDDVIRTAWDNEPLMQYVTKSEIKGNVKVGFELSATDAEIHAEGAAAPSEEELKLGIVELVPQTIKKWITISDEVLDLNSKAFLDYVYREITYKIAHKAAAIIVEKILGAPATATASKASVKTLNAEISTKSIIEAEAELSDEARNVVVVVSKANEAALKSAALSGSFAYDPFDGLPHVTSDTVGDAMIVGDLSAVAANFPNGNDVTFKYDDLSLAEKDLVKIVGREPVAIELTACKRICVVKKTA